MFPSIFGQDRVLFPLEHCQVQIQSLLSQLVAFLASPFPGGLINGYSGIEGILYVASQMSGGINEANVTAARGEFEDGPKLQAARVNAQLKLFSATAIAMDVITSTMDNHDGLV